VHRGSHPVAAACVDGRPRRVLLPPASIPSSGTASAPWGRHARGSVSSTSLPSSDLNRSAWPASLGFLDSVGSRDAPPAVVRALPWSSCPIRPPVMVNPHIIHHHTLGLNISSTPVAPITAIFITHLLSRDTSPPFHWGDMSCLGTSRLDAWRISALRWPRSLRPAWLSCVG
jgi:hypothetical protein